MNPAAVQGALAGGAVIASWWVWGWQGLLLVASALTFVLLMQFTRAMRTLRQAAQRPVGSIRSAVMLQARLSHGMSLREVIALTGSLGHPVGTGGNEDWLWRDAGGDEVVVSLRRGRVVRWSIARHSGPPADPAESGSLAPQAPSSPAEPP